MNKPAVSIFRLLVISAWLMGLLPGLKAATKDYYFPEVRTEISIQKDGSFVVDEYRTYEFEGSFSQAWIIIPLRIDRHGYRYNVSIEGFVVADENGRPIPVESSRSGGTFRGEWSYRANNERRTFHLHYRVRGGIISYPDVSELYWQAIGSEWDRPTAKAEVTVSLPEPAGIRRVPTETVSRSTQRPS